MGLRTTIGLRRSALSGVVAAVFLFALPSTSQEKPSLKVVVNADNPIRDLPRQTISEMFLYTVKRWEGGGSAIEGQLVEPVDQPEDSQIWVDFSVGVHRKRPSLMKRYWQKIIFGAKGRPPPKRAGDGAVLAFVGKRLGAIGYVSAEASLPSSVREICVLPKHPDEADFKVVVHADNPVRALPRAAVSTVLQTEESGLWRHLDSSLRRRDFGNLPIERVENLSSPLEVLEDICAVMYCGEGCPERKPTSRKVAELSNRIGDSAVLALISRQAGAVGYVSGDAALPSSVREVRMPETASPTSGFKVVVHSDNPIRELPRRRVSDLFLGRYSGWNDVDSRVQGSKIDGLAVQAVGQPERLAVWKRFAVGVHCRESDDRLRSLVCDSERALLALIGERRGAVGYVSADARLPPNIAVLRVVVVGN